MDKEKFDEAKETLRKLFAIQQEHIRNTAVKTVAEKNIYNKLDGLIVEAAADLLDAYADKENALSKPQKSEMLCNCKPKTLPEIIDEAKAELTDSKTFAAIVFRMD